MKIIKTKFKGLKLIKTNLYSDNRGYLREILKKKELNKDLIFHYFAKSKKNVFRGFHFQSKNQQEKLVSVLEVKLLIYVLILERIHELLGNYLKFYCQKKIKHQFLYQKDSHMDILLWKNSI